MNELNENMAPGLGMEYECERFKIENDKMAEWALAKIKDAGEERDRLLTLIQDKKAELEEKAEKVSRDFESATGYLKSLLFEYMGTVKTKDTKTAKTYALLSGKLQIKRGGMKYNRDEAALVEWAKNSHPEFIKTKESIDWANLKKQTEVLDGGEVLDITTGEIIDGVTAEQEADSFNIIF